jgi:type IV pilus assembly protein PilA
MAANESSAVESVQTIMAAENTYSSLHPQAGYTCAMTDLGNDHLIDSKLASGPRNGYAFELMACSPGPDGNGNRSYQVVAYPVTVNQTGVRAFCGDESGLIRVDEKGSPQNCLQSGQPLQ